MTLDILALNGKECKIFDDFLSDTKTTLILQDNKISELKHYYNINVKININEQEDGYEKIIEYYSDSFLEKILDVNIFELNENFKECLLNPQSNKYDKILDIVNFLKNALKLIESFKKYTSKPRLFNVKFEILNNSYILENSCYTDKYYIKRIIEKSFSHFKYCDYLFTHESITRNEIYDIDVECNNNFKNNVIFVINGKEYNYFDFNENTNIFDNNFWISDLIKVTSIVDFNDESKRNYIIEQGENTIHIKEIKFNNEARLCAIINDDYKLINKTEIIRKRTFIKNLNHAFIDSYDDIIDYFCYYVTWKYYYFKDVNIYETETNNDIIKMLKILYKRIHHNKNLENYNILLAFRIGSEHRINKYTKCLDY